MIAQTVSDPIAPEDRVSDVLARDEALVEVFVRRSSHFGKLRSRAMRRVMARLVTVEQAARIAGIPTELLVRDLNAALGIDPVDIVGTAQCAAGAATPEPTSRPKRPLDAPEVELDVRADLRNGREPFSRIIEAVAELEPGAVLRLRAIFEPAPLFTVLARRGFVHESRCDGEDDWSVWFWRASERGASAPEAPHAAPAPVANEIILDVRGLEPPEPLMRTLAALETLPDGSDLVQVNVRVPQFLIPMLGERGFVCEIDDSRADLVLVRIHRPR